MSGTASRYIGGVPYGPAMGVGRYPTQSSLLSAPGPRDVGGAVLRPVTDGLGIAVNPATGNVAQAGGGGQNMLLAAALGLLGYAPDIYNAASKFFGSETPPAQQRPFPDDPTPTSDGVTLPNFPVGSRQWFDAIDPTPLGDGAASDGFGQMGTPAGNFASVSAPAGGAPSLGGQTLPDNWGAGSLGETPYFGGDLATLGAGTAGGAIGGLISSQVPWTREGYGSIGQQAGSALGGIGAGMAVGALYGSTLGPIGTAAGALAGAFGGGMIGAGAGSQMGPLPTVGRNFGATGTFGADGSLAWGGMGGDNGGESADAQVFANQFGQNLLAQAGQQGLAFNPNMAGLQFDIGGYDNPSRSGIAPGGFFFDPYRSGSPENNALRPNGGGLDPYSAAQGNALTQAALADLTARGVFTQGGAAQPGRDYFNQTLGADNGFYGYQTYGQQDLPTFAQSLAQRQGAIGGFLTQQQQAQQYAADAAAWEQANNFGAQMAGVVEPGVFSGTYSPGGA